MNPTSQFATWVLGQATADTTLVDLGCGWGHDVVAYARAGHQAIGLDYSRPAFARAAALARRAGLSAEFATFNVNDLRSVLATGTSLVAGDRRLIVAVHLFAEALSTEGRDGLWRICAMVGRTGGQTFLGTIAENSQAPLHPLLAAVSESSLHSEIAEFGGTLCRVASSEPGVDWWSIQWTQQ